MNPDHEKNLESHINDQLKGLGELTAPVTLMPRIMRAIEQRAALPWYRRGWASWPASMQFASTVLLFILPIGGCWGAMEFSKTPMFGSAVEQGSRLVGFWEIVLRVVGVLKESVMVVVGQVRPEFLAIAVGVILVAWVACAGLGTVYVRLAMRPAVNRN